VASSERVRAPAKLPRDTDLLDFLVRLPPEKQQEAVRRLGFTDLDAFDRDWPTWAHDGQQPPSDRDWSTCVIMGGRGFGKTRAGAEWIVSLLRGQSGDSLSDRPPSAGDSLSDCPRRLPPRRSPIRIALVAATLAEARQVMVEGPSGLLEVAGPWIREWRPSLGRLRFRTGAQAQLFSGHSPGLLRGPAHDYAWCDELAKWEKAGETWDMLQMGLRVGKRPRALVTTTPRPGPVLKRIMALPGSVTIGGPSHANPHNSEAWQRDMAERYAGTRLERQELHGELLPDAPGALWTVELIERSRQRGTLPRDGPDNSVVAHPEEAVSPSNRRLEGRPFPPGAHESAAFVRVVIAVDPPSGDGTCGIVACARDEEGRAHVLADHSVAGRSPEGWARAVADAAALWGHSYTSVPVPIPVQVVAESNQGGLMVKSVLRIADPDLRVKLVTATQGKSDRASPVAMLFEAGKVTLHGRFPELEAQLLGMIAGGEYEGPGTSPDRADAMVWALTELMLGRERGEPRIRVL